MNVVKVSEIKFYDDGRLKWQRFTVIANLLVIRCSIEGDDKKIFAETAKIDDCVVNNEQIISCQWFNEIIYNAQHRRTFERILFQVTDNRQRRHAQMEIASKIKRGEVISSVNGTFMNITACFYL